LILFIERRVFDMGEEEKPQGQPEAIQYAPPPNPSQVATQNSAAAVEGAGNVLNSGILGRYAQQQTDIQSAQAPQLAALYNQVQQQYSPQMVDLAISNLKRADPTGFAIRENLGSQIGSELSMGGGLTPEEQRLAQQDIRAGQVSRGSGTGFSDAVDEARYLGNERFNRMQQRQNAAFNFTNNMNPAAAANAQAPVSTPDVSGFAQGLFPTTGQLIGSQQGYFNAQSNNIGNQNAFNQNAFQFGVANTRNRLKEDIMFGLGVGEGVSGMAGTAVGTAAKAYTGCWVAMELYGREAPKTHRIRAFVHKHLQDASDLGKFCRDYLEKGRQWTLEVIFNQDSREFARKVWDQLDEMAQSENKLKA
jgi:hypothetical protein